MVLRPAPILLTPIIRTEQIGTLDKREVHLAVDVRRAVDISVGRSIKDVNRHGLESRPTVILKLFYINMLRRGDLHQYKSLG